jgi:secretion/DNA translocation related TadE-like protein
MSDDRGVATVWVAGAIAVLVSMMVFGLHLGEAVVVRHQVEAAADLAALAGAATAVAGEQYACSQARRVTDRMRVQLASCQLRGWDVLVRATAHPRNWPAPLGAATAQARAGPAGGASRRELDRTGVLLDDKVRAVEFTARSGVQ